jgi:hypothetical protein
VKNLIVLLFWELGDFVYGVKIARIVGIAQLLGGLVAGLNSVKFE